MWSDVYFHNKIASKSKLLDAVIPSIKCIFQPALLYDSHTSYGSMYVCMYVCLCVYVSMHA